MHKVSLYRRLVIVDNKCLDEEKEKLRIFLKELFSIGNKLDIIPTYDNIEICVAHKKNAAELFFTNIDVHITSKFSYALAFQVKDLALDNFEWSDGYWPRFGLVEVDYKTLERKVRPSARMYAEICKNNRIVISNKT